MKLHHTRLVLLAAVTLLASVLRAQEASWTSEGAASSGTLAEAFASADDNSVITLLTDAVVSEVLKPLGRTLTLTGTGTLTRAADYTSGALIELTGTGTFTLDAITIDGAGVSAKSGLVKMNSRTSLVARGVTFRHAVTTTDGGALAGSTGTNVTLTDCTFDHNTARKGGALFVRGSFDIARCTFTSNQATDAGGALYLTTDLALTDGTFSGNTSTTYDDAVFCYFGNGITLAGSIDMGSDCIYLPANKVVTLTAPLTVHNARHPLIIDTANTYDNTFVATLQNDALTADELHAWAVETLPAFQHRQGCELSAVEGTIRIGPEPEPVTFKAKEGATYTLHRNGNTNAYMYQNGSLIPTGPYDKNTRCYWLFEPTGKEGCYFVRNATSGQYIQSTNITLSSAVSMGSTPVEFYVARDITGGASTSGFYYLCSTDQTIDNSVDGTLGLNLGSTGVVAYHIRTGRGNSYWEIEEHEYDYEPYVHHVERTPYSRSLGLVYVPCGSTGAAYQYLAAVNVSGKGVTDELHYTASARPGAYVLWTQDRCAVTPGTPFTLAVEGAKGGNASTNLSGMTFTAYLDWDGDGEFETSSTPLTGKTAYTLDIDVPSDATLGEHRLRLRINTGDGPDADDEVIGCCYDFVMNVVESDGNRTLTVSPNSPSRGTVTIDGEEVSSVTYPYGTRVTVNATPLGNASFTAWKEGRTVVSKDPSYTFTLGADQSLTAVFTPNTDIGSGIHFAPALQHKGQQTGTYDLFGRRVEHPGKGLYIVDGRLKLLK